MPSLVGGGTFAGKKKKIGMQSRYHLIWSLWKEINQIASEDSELTEHAFLLSMYIGLNYLLLFDFVDCYEVKL